MKKISCFGCLKWGVLLACTKDNIFRKKKLEISGLPTPPYTYICLLRFKKFLQSTWALVKLNLYMGQYVVDAENTLVGPVGPF